jgi:hypothetical protein
MHEPEETKQWLADYMKKLGYSRQDISAARRSPKYSRTVATVARILYNGNEIPDSSKKFFDTNLAIMISTGHAVKEDKDDSDQPVVAAKPTLTIQERMQAKNRLLVAECEESIDKNPRLNIYDWLTGKEATSAAANAVRDYYARWIKDFEFVDEHATRADKKHQADHLKYWQQFVADCDRYADNKKVAKVRKPQVKKTKPAVDLVKKLSYQKEYPPLKIVSVNPADVIGATQLWTYNTKYRKLSRYDAAGPGGIQVKGTSLIGIDVERSITKRVRKPDEAIKAVLGAGKIALRKLMDDIKTEGVQSNGRINNDTILLRVIK